MKATLSFAFFLLLISTAVSAQDTWQNPNSTSETVEIKTTKHRVSKGETLYAISRLYEVSVTEIMDMNPYINKNNIDVGDVLLIPRENSMAVGLQETTVERSATTQNAGRNAPVNNTKVLRPGDTQFNSKGYRVESTPVRRGEIISFPIPTIPNTSITESTYIGDTPPTHVVQRGETLTSIARYYGLNVKQLKKINRMSETDGLTSSELIFLRNMHSHSRQTMLAKHNAGLEFERNPRAREEAMVDKVDYTKMKPILHTATKGETLYSLARTYNHSVSSIKKWNNLASDDLGKGQELIIGWMVPGNDMAKSGTVANSGMARRMTAERIANERVVFDQMKKFEDKFREQIANSYNSELKTGNCVATYMRGNDSDEQNLFCLSRTIPPMTIVHLTNPMNGKSIYVKVISDLPPTSDNGNADIKLTEAAVKELGILDRKFQVEYSYFVE